MGSGLLRQEETQKSAGPSVYADLIKGSIESRAVLNAYLRF